MHLLRRSLTDPPVRWAWLGLTLLGIACAVLLVGWLVVGVNPFLVFRGVRP